MSPVSRGRRSKGTRKSKNKNRSQGRPAPAGSQVRQSLLPERGDFSPSALASLLDAGNRRSWPWWEASHDEVLAAAAALTDCDGPEDLEQATAELIGDRLWQRLQTEVAGHDYLGWMSRLIDVIDERRAESGAWLLAHGLAAICPQPHRDRLLTVIGQDRGEAHPAAPSWLALVPQLRVDGDPQVVVDGYGGRYGVMVDLARPGAAARTYLIDVDLCLPFVSPPSGWHADSGSAVAAWRAQVGPSADAAVRPQPVGGELLVQLLPRDLDVIGPTLMGNERRDQLAEFFRMRRVVEQVRSSLGLDDALPSPIAEEAVRSRVDDFVAWCADRDVAVPGGGRRWRGGLRGPGTWPGGSTTDLPARFPRGGGRRQGGPRWALLCPQVPMAGAGSGRRMTPERTVDEAAELTVEQAADLAGRCRVVKAAPRLAEWVASHRPQVTPGGALRPAEVPAAARALGIRGVGRVRRAADVPDLHRAWLMAAAANLISVEARSAGGGPALARGRRPRPRRCWPPGWTACGRSVPR